MAEHLFLGYTDGCLARRWHSRLLIAATFPNTYSGGCENPGGVLFRNLNLFLA
jgi:hypothetical protein